MLLLQLHELELVFKLLLLKSLLLLLLLLQLLQVMPFHFLNIYFVILEKYKYSCERTPKNVQYDKSTLCGLPGSEQRPQRIYIDKTGNDG